MIDLTLFLDFYFTPYLFGASVFYGVFRLTKYLMRGN